MKIRDFREKFTNAPDRRRRFQAPIAKDEAKVIESTYCCSSTGRITALKTYRLCFCRGRELVGRETFHAEDAMSARYIGAAIFDACSDCCDSYELWDGVYRIDVRLPVTAAMLDGDRQTRTIETEEAILNSAWAVSKSQRLLARLRELKNGPEH